MASITRLAASNPKDLMYTIETRLSTKCSSSRRSAVLRSYLIRSFPEPALSLHKLSSSDLLPHHAAKRVDFSPINMSGGENPEQPAIFKYLKPKDRGHIATTLKFKEDQARDTMTSEQT